MAWARKIGPWKENSRYFKPFDKRCQGQQREVAAATTRIENGSGGEGERAGKRSADGEIYTRFSVSLEVDTEFDCQVPFGMGKAQTASSLAALSAILPVLLCQSRCRARISSRPSILARLYQTSSRAAHHPFRARLANVWFMARLSKRSARGSSARADTRAVHHENLVV